jgi:tRNA modification GTPase
MTPQDTIAAVSTPVGPGGIGIVRLSGPDALSIAEKLSQTGGLPLSRRQSHTVAYAKLVDPVSGDLVDEVLITVMRAPTSYTREDVVEINCHSGTPTLHMVLRLVLGQGARAAEPGEFTKRAFLSGRIDLTQAEAVAALVQARTESAARAAARQADGHLGKKLRAIRVSLVDLRAQLEAALDFSDEDVDPIVRNRVKSFLQTGAAEIEALMRLAERGRLINKGVRTAIVGRPNVGKSSLLNALAMEDKAIVSPEAGTTRDIVEAQAIMARVLLDLKDTAGWRAPLNDIEAQGIARSRRAFDQADLAILVLDGSERLQAEDHELFKALEMTKPLVIAINKGDLPPALSEEELPPALRGTPVVKVSATTRAGLDRLAESVGSALGLSDLEGGETIVANARQESDLSQARGKLLEAVGAYDAGYGEEIVSMLVGEAVCSLGRLSGEDLTEELLDQIFSSFCIGK